MGATAALLVIAIGMGLIAAVGRLDRHLAAVNKIDLQHATGERPELVPLVAALKEPIGLEWILRSTQLLLFVAILAVAVGSLPPSLRGAVRGVLLLPLALVAVLLEAWGRHSNGHEAVRELPRFARVMAPLWRFLKPAMRAVEWLLSRGNATTLAVPYVTGEELHYLRELDRFRTEEVDAEEEAIIDRIFHLKETGVSQIMVPIVDVVALEADQTLDEAIQTVNRARFSRIPVFQRRIYNIVGVLHAFDLLASGSGQRRVGDLAHAPLYVPETMTAESLLELLRERQGHMAVVVDEYGGAAGIVTAEDVIEELVGEITDEHDAERRDWITPLPEGGWRVQSRVTLDEFENVTGIELESQLSDTVAGFLLEQFHRIPCRGEELNLADLRITIRDASERQILTVDIVPA